MRRLVGCRSSSWRRWALVAAVLLLPGTWGWATTSAAPGSPTPHDSTPCAVGSAAAWSAQMDAYAHAGAFPAVQAMSAGRAASVLVEIPAIHFTGAGQSATLPVGPCQHIYRFAYANVQAPAGAARPFAYAEIDWNTEGEARGPNGSFASPHFDFHFYLQPRDEIERRLSCVSTNGRTCDAFQTAYEQMRQFQNLPDAAFVPATYRPDVGSAIPAMGLHLLDASFDYTLDAVNHHPTLIYGTFGGKVVFAEASVTLDTLQDALAAPDHRLSFPFAQPSAFATEIDWPTTFTIEYLPASGGIKVGFASFAHHAP